MSSTDTAAADICSPSKIRRTETTPCILIPQHSSAFTTTSSASTTPTAATPPPPILTSTAAPTTPPTTATTTQSQTLQCGSSDDKRTAAPALEVTGPPKDSLIAQILAGTDSDFGETSGLCPPGVFFDESCYPTTAPSTPCSYSPQDNWTSEHSHTPPYSSMTHNHSVMMTSAAAIGVSKSTRSLLVAMEARGGPLQHTIEQVVQDHELITCSPAEALTLVNERPFNLIWLRLPCPPSEDILGVITFIRYSSKLNRKTILLGVTHVQPEIDLNLHGIDEIIMDPVSKSTIRQKYFDWTSVKLTPDYELSMRDPPMCSTTPESSISTESNIDLNLSSLASDGTNDSGVHAEMDVVDLKPPPFLFAPHHLSPGSDQTQKSHKSRPANPSTGSLSEQPTWCRAEHATKEKHRSSSQVHRERIKDSCDQLRVLLPYVRGRKTDMASILEMTVDYLKIVNSKLPHEFHAHVLDVMTKGGNSPPSSRPAGRSNGGGSDQVSPGSSGGGGGGRGSRGGRGRGSSRRNNNNNNNNNSNSNNNTSPTYSSVQDRSDVYSGQGRMLTRSLSRGSTSTPVCTGNGTRSSKGAKRSAHSSVVMSPGSNGVSSLYLSDGKDTRGNIQREESVIANNNVSLPHYMSGPHHPAAPHLFSDPPPPSSLCYPPLSGPPPTSTSPSDCGMSMPRLYASAHLSVDPSFLSHGTMGNPNSLPPPMSSRYSLGGGGGGERGDGGGGGGGVGPGSYGDVGTGAFYHYFSNMPELNPAYSVAGGGQGVVGGGGGCGGGPPPPHCGDFMSSGGSLLPLSANSAFSSPRIQMPPPPLRGKGDMPLLSAGAVNPGDSSGYGMMDTSTRTSK